MSGAQVPSCLVSEKIRKVLAALYAYHAAFLTYLDAGKVTAVFHVAAFQVRPIRFDFGA
jgi:hypothetical protein